MSRRMKLTLNNILNTVRDAGPKKWFRVGLALGNERNELETIETNYKNDVAECQLKMYSLWLDDDTEACWEKLAACVSTTGDRNVGQQIAEREGFDLDDAIQRYCGPIPS